MKKFFVYSTIFLLVLSLVNTTEAFQLTQSSDDKLFENANNVLIIAVCIMIYSGDTYSPR